MAVGVDASCWVAVGLFSIIPRLVNHWHDLRECDVQPVEALFAVSVFLLGCRGWHNSMDARHPKRSAQVRCIHLLYSR